MPRGLRILLFLLLGWPLWASAQTTVVRGKVTEANTAEAIPFATILVKGSTTGTKTDFDGNYILTVPEGYDTLVFRVLGYQEKQRVVISGIEQTINVQLERKSSELREVRVRPGINPAIRIIQAAVDRRKANDYERLDAYEAESFSKIEIAFDQISEKFRNRKVMKPLKPLFDTLNFVDTEEGQRVLPIFQSEAVSDFYWTREPLRTKEYIKATRVNGIGFEDGSLLSQIVGATFNRYNFYENYLTILDKEFISPIGDGAMKQYDYRLLDSTFIGDQWCYEIRVLPMNNHDLAFIGTIWITDTTFAIRRVSLEVEKRANINYIERIKIEQDYVPTTAGAWFPAKNRILIDIAELRGETAGVIAKMYISYSNLEVNKVHPDKFYERNIEVAEDAQIKEDTFWVNHRPDQPTELELRTSQMIDSIRNIPRVKTTFEIAQTIFSGYKNLGKIDFGPYLYSYSFNHVEGHRVRLGARTNIKFSRKWVFRGYVAYGFKDKRFKGSLGAEYIISRKKWTVAGVQYRHDIDQIGVTDNPFGSGNNSLMAAFSIITTLNRLNESIEQKVWFERQFTSSFSAKITLHHKQFTPRGDFAFAYYYYPNDSAGGLHSAYQTTTMNLEFKFARQEVFFQNDNERISVGARRGPVYRFGYAFGVKDILWSDFTYHKLYFNVSQNVKCGRVGYFLYSGTLGKTFNPVPYTLLEVHRGNQSWVAAFNTFNTMNFFEFVSEQFASIAVEHHFEGFISNDIPLMKRWKWRFVLNGKAVYGSVSEKNRQMMANLDALGRTVNTYSTLERKPFVEAGYGIENIFSFLRVDFIHRLTYRDVPNASNFGVKISVAFTF